MLEKNSAQNILSGLKNIHVTHSRTSPRQFIMCHRWWTFAHKESLLNFDLSRSSGNGECSQQWFLKESSVFHRDRSTQFFFCSENNLSWFVSIKKIVPFSHDNICMQIFFLSHLFSRLWVVGHILYVINCDKKSFHIELHARAEIEWRWWKLDSDPVC